MAAARAHSLRTSTFALGVALAVHAVAAAALVRLDEARQWPVEPPVDMEVRDVPPPPPPQTRPESPEPPRPKPTIRRVARLETPPEPPLLLAPPPPNQEPPPEPPKTRGTSGPTTESKTESKTGSKTAAPVFGVTADSVVSDEAAMAAPVGNTTMTSDHRPSKTVVRPYAGDGIKPNGPVSDVYVAVRPRKLYEINSEDIYPPDARALGIEGVVKLSVAIDEKGHVVDVRLIQPAGHAFDEAAVQALKQFRFSPALTSDGRAVPFRFTYDYRFEIGN